MNILVGTLILWGITVLVVQPLANHLVQRRLQEPAYAHEKSPNEQDERAREELASLATHYFVISDVLILGIAGFVLGLVLGSPFIGVAWDRKFWPGMIALMAASFVGAFLVV